MLGPLVPHPRPALLAVVLGLTRGGAVELPPLGYKGPTADGAGLEVRGRAVSGEGGLQPGIEGQDGLPEVAAQGPRPAFAQHIALAVQWQAPIFPVIVGAPLHH